MHFDMAGIDHQPFIIRLIDQNFQKFSPYTFSAPSDEPLMNAAPLAAMSRQMGFLQCPYVIAYVMSVIGCLYLFLFCLFMMLPFYHNPLTLCRRYLGLWWVPWPSSLCQRRFEIVRLVFDIDHGAVMQNAIQDGRGNGDVGKDLVPLGEVLLEVKAADVFSYRLVISRKKLAPRMS